METGTIHCKGCGGSLKAFISKEILIGRIVIICRCGANNEFGEKKTVNAVYPKHPPRFTNRIPTTPRDELK